MSSPYEIRSNDNGKSKKQSMAELKLRRLTELNQRLQEDLNRRRIPVSEAALEYVAAHGVPGTYMQHSILTTIPVSSHSPTRSPKTLWSRADGEL